jgi:hypothetical protein
MVSPARPCLLCKGGRNLCGNKTCPLLPRFNIAPRIKKELGTEFFGPSFSVFVGRDGYPSVGAGPLAAIENREEIDNPAGWFGKSYQDLITLRSFILRSSKKESIFSRSRFVLENQEIAMAGRPADVELSFKGVPSYTASFSDVTNPMGPSASLLKMRIAGNVHVPLKIERVVTDEMKAVESVRKLYSSGHDVHRITSIISSGALGLDANKKLVPTRWGITAIDDIIAKGLMEKIREFPQVGEFIVFEAGYLHNHFIILLMPGRWEFENFEAWAPGSTWSMGLKKTEIIEEHEPFSGRCSYADKQAGGYYAARIAVAEKLMEMGRQASVVSFREVYEGYVVPLGVWVIRETVRSACRASPVKFQTREEALKYIGARLRIPVPEYAKRSKIFGKRNVMNFMRG